MVEEIEHDKIIESASRKQPKIYLCPNIRNIIIEILNQLRNMPAEDLKRNGLIKARSFKTIYQSSLVLFWVVYQIVDDEGVSSHSNY